MSKNIKVVFMGTPEFSVPVLDMLIKNTNVLMVVTQPDTYVGRKKVLTKSPVKLLAEANGIPVFQPEKIRKDYEVLKELDFDLLVTCAYGQILPKEILDMPKYGPINVHASLLPKYRGASPINFAIFNGEEKTGVTLMYMDEGMDTGDVIVQDSLDINGDNYGELYKSLSVLGANLLFENLDYLVSGNVEHYK
jgi:methionyl-tRNA formyltransferase